MLMNPSLLRRLLLFSVVAMSTSLLQAGAKFGGSTGYEIAADGNTVSLQAERIENTSAENATGTLYMKLWALDAPYKGGTLSGTLLGAYKLEGLAPGRRYNAIKRSVPLTYPSAKKNYAICLTLLEYKNGAYVIVDQRNMPNPRLLGPAKLFTLEGPWSWKTSYEGGTIDLNVAKISHRRTGNTGSLKLSAWATVNPYRGGPIKGFELGSVTKKALAPGYSYTNVKNTEKFTPPPNGDYYVTLVLLEFTGTEYVIQDYIASLNLSKFKK